MKIQDKAPSRQWKMEDLLAIGKKSGITYLKAVPILFVETWVKQGKGMRAYVRTEDLKDRLVDSGVHEPFRKKGSSNIMGALITIQESRFLTNPPLIMHAKTRGEFWINNDEYKDLLEEYRQYYVRNFPDDFKKLFPEGESQLDVRDETTEILAPVEQALRNMHEEIARLRDENLNLRTEIANLQKILIKREAYHHIIVDEELRRKCEEFMKNPDTYPEAILRATKLLEDRLMKIVGSRVTATSYGKPMVEHMLSAKSGRLIISDEPNEQDGICNLFKGSVQYMRNPVAHKNISYTDIQAWQVIIFVDYLLGLLGQAKLRTDE